MLFPSAQKCLQCPSYDRSDSYTAASRVLAEQFHRAWGELQGNWYRDLGYYDWLFEVRGFFQVAIGLTL